MGVKIFRRLMLLPLLVLAYTVIAAGVLQMLNEQSSVLVVLGFMFVIAMILSFQASAQAFVFDPIARIIQSSIKSTEKETK